MLPCRPKGKGAHLVGSTKTRPNALPLPARASRGEGRGEGLVYSPLGCAGAFFVIRLVAPQKCARAKGQSERRSLSGWNEEVHLPRLDAVALAPLFAQSLL